MNILDITVAEGAGRSRQAAGSVQVRTDLGVYHFCVNAPDVSHGGAGVQRTAMASDAIRQLMRLPEFRRAPGQICGADHALLRLGAPENDPAVAGHMNSDPAPLVLRAEWAVDAPRAPDQRRLASLAIRH